MISAEQVQQKKITSITFSRWGESDYDLGGFSCKNAANEESELFGFKKYEFETITLKNKPIESIQVVKKNEEYLRGFRINYRNGRSQIMNSTSGIEQGQVTFKEGDELVGFTVVCTSPEDKRPRKIGFTIMRRKGNGYEVI